MIKGLTKKMKRVKITVMKITEYKDLMEQYENKIEHTCDMKVGQVFFVEDMKKPEGFCESAWETIKQFATELANDDGNFYDGWMKNEHSAIMISCNDGFRPVSFLLEAI